MELDPCPCGNPRTIHKTVAFCHHCDEPETVQGRACRWCYAYHAAVNRRVHEEYEAERKQRG